MLRRTAHENMTKTHWYVFVLLILLFGSVQYFSNRAQRPGTPVAPGSFSEIDPRPISPGCVDVRGQIQRLADQTGQSNLEALALFELDLHRVLDESKPQLHAAAKTAAQKAAAYGSCCDLIAGIAQDAVLGGNRAGEHLSDTVRPVIKTPLVETRRRVEVVLGKLDYDLQRNTVGMATQFAAIDPRAEPPVTKIRAGADGKIDLARSLQGLGFDTAGAGIALGFDGFFLSKSHVFKTMIKRLLGIAGRLFGRQIAIATASVGAAVIDGPLPFGDILAVGGLAWTAYDIHSGQQQFQQEVRESLETYLQQQHQSMHAQAVQSARKLVEQHREFQQKVASQTLAQVKGGVYR